MDTQTNTHMMNHQSTMTDPPFNSGVDTEEPKDLQKRISGKNKIEKKLQIGQKSGKVSKQNNEIKKRINRCHQGKKEKISNKNGRKLSGGFSEEIINKDTNLHDEFQKSEKQNGMDLEFIEGNMRELEYESNSSSKEEQLNDDFTQQITLPIGKFTNLLIISEQDAPLDCMINNSLKKAINKYMKLMKNVSIKYEVDPKMKASRLYPKNTNNIVMKTLQRADVVTFFRG
ncbi:hypothetical protein JTB14_029552 [Gonioctena quinquepunctata]|nr:hypothetical protein JTB14_029552 [Gonioctena quinquepunctata]